MVQFSTGNRWHNQIRIIQGRLIIKGLITKKDLGRAEGRGTIKSCAGSEC